MNWGLPEMYFSFFWLQGNNFVVHEAKRMRTKLVYIALFLLNIYIVLSYSFWPFKASCEHQKATRVDVLGYSRQWQSIPTYPPLT